MVSMKELPINFTGTSVRAILEGRKTMTRRVIDPKPGRSLSPGVRLWVREQFYLVPWTDDGFQEYDKPFYFATLSEDDLGDIRGCKLRPASHMPRWASRINLEVINIHVEQLQQITERDAIAEGALNRDEFVKIWDLIYSKRGYGWDINPVVLVIEFKRV